MKVIIFGEICLNDSFLLKNQEYSIIGFIENSVSQKFIDYNDCNLNIIPLVDICSLEYDAIIIVKDKNEKFVISEIVEYLNYKEIPKEKIFLLSQDGEEENELISFSKIKEYLNINVGYRTIFEITHPKSILLTHEPYILERTRNRKLFIYGVGYESFCATKLLAQMGIEVEKYVSDDNIHSYIGNNKEIISTIDLVYENKENYFILLANENENYEISRRKFHNLGLIEDYDYSWHYEIPGTKESFYYDVNLSYNRIKDKIEGFEVFGDIENSNAIKIFALGGSTTESTLFCVRGWVQFFADILKEKGISAIIYCGGTSGYTSTQELLKLIRDVIPQKPDLVLSYSGANDLYNFPNTNEKERYGRPFITKFQVQFMDQIINKLSSIEYGLPIQNIPEWDRGTSGKVFYGLQNDKTSSCFWIDNMRMMHSLSCEMGFEFISFLQPFRCNGYYGSSIIQDIIHSRRDPSCTPFDEAMSRWYLPIKDDLNRMIEEVKKYEYICDFSNIFQDFNDIYYDTTHVYERGNIIVANKVYKTIKTVLLNLQNKKTTNLRSDF